MEITSAIIKVFVVVFVFELVGILLGYFVGANTVSPQLQQLNMSVQGSYLYNLNATIGYLTSSGNYALIQSSQCGTGLLDGLCNIGNILIAFFNLLGKIANVIIQIVSIIIQAILLLAFIFIILLPSLFSTSAMPSFLIGIFDLGYILIFCIIIFFVIELVLRIFKK